MSGRLLHAHCQLLDVGGAERRVADDIVADVASNPYGVGIVIDVYDAAAGVHGLVGALQRQGVVEQGLVVPVSWLLGDGVIVFARAVHHAYRVTAAFYAAGQRVANGGIAWHARLKTGLDRRHMQLYVRHIQERHEAGNDQKSTGKREYVGKLAPPRAAHPVRRLGMAGSFGYGRFKYVGRPYGALR